MQKKKVLFCSDYCGIKSGFGGFMREILTYLYKTDKYELTLFANGITFDHPDFDRWPWQIFGSVPNNQSEWNHLKNDPTKAALLRDATYGDYYIDKVIGEVKPDVYFAVQDPWGIHFCTNKFWWNKISCIVHTTIDSRPLLQMAIDLAKNTKHFYCWADFATQEFQKIGQPHVKTLRGTVNTDTYRKLLSHQKESLRDRFNIPQDAYCIGMLSRNQLRKSFINLLKGYKKFKDKYPEATNTRLLLFTHFSEGWNIPRWCKEFGIDESEILATYKCRATGDYFVLPFKGQRLNNPKTNHQKSLVTVNIEDGLTEEQVNEWYNLLDVYAHPFTSGGQERSIQEAKLAELVTLVTNYSCGEDSCVNEAASFSLDYHEYWETGTEFIKATTDPHSISKELYRVFKMEKKSKEEMGRKARQWVLDNFSIPVIGKKIEEILDALPFTDFDFKHQPDLKNPTAIVDMSLPTEAFIKECYKQILNRDIDSTDEGVIYWLGVLNESNNINSDTRNKTVHTFRNIAYEHNAKENKVNLEDLFIGEEKPEDRILINIPESLGDCIYITALLRDARELYPNHKIYVATKPQFQDVFKPLVGELIDYVIEWLPTFDQTLAIEGYADNKHYVDMCYQPHHGTQRLISYYRHAHDLSKINLEYGSPA